MLSQLFALLPLRPCAHPRRVSEDYEHDPISHMMQLPQWLGLDPALVSPAFKLRAKVPNAKLHIGHYDSTPSEETLQQLRTFFAPHNERLFKLLEAKGFGQQAARMKELWSAPPAVGAAVAAV